MLAVTAAAAVAATQSEENSAADSSEEEDSHSVSLCQSSEMEDQYVVHTHHQGEFYTHPPHFTSNTKEEQGEHQVREDSTNHCSATQ